MRCPLRRPPGRSPVNARIAPSQTGAASSHAVPAGRCARVRRGPARPCPVATLADVDEAAAPAPGTLDDVREEGLRLAEAAEAARVPLRLMGGVAVWARCPSVRLPALARVPGDVDLIG